MKGETGSAKTSWLVDKDDLKALPFNDQTDSHNKRRRCEHKADSLLQAARALPNRNAGCSGTV